MSDLYGLNLEPMPNRLVNYGTTDNGIAVIELASDSAGAPLEGDAMDLESVKNAMEELTIASQGFAQRLYETASQEAEAQEDESEDIIDAEIIDEDE